MIEGKKLTKRERDIFTLRAKGFRGKEIASELGIAEQTVKCYIAHMRIKFECHNSVQLCYELVKGGLIE